MSREGFHINNMEAFWSVLKRTLGGTYVAPRPQHLERYLDEQIFRWVNRETSDGVRFPRVAQKAEGKRLTYKSFIGKIC